jgi:hypothetical protein
MRTVLRRASGVMLAVALAAGGLLGGGASGEETRRLPEVASALALTLEQRQAIYQAVVKQPGPVARAADDTAPEVGAKLPASAPLSDLPDDVAREFPAARGYKYLMAQDRVVLVDPGSGSVVGVIDRDTVELERRDDIR